MEMFLYPLAKFALAICITEEGKEYLQNTCILRFILESVVQSGSVLPKSLGFSMDAISKIGRTFTKIIIECEAARPGMKVLLKDKLLSLCRQVNLLTSLLSLYISTTFPFTLGISPTLYPYIPYRRNKSG
jgi:hypothetical protein